MDSEELLKTYHLFFPGDKYREDDFAAALDSGDVIVDPEKIVNLLQSALLDEAIVEVELDDLTRVFFCRVLDHTPELEERETDGELLLVEPEYTQAEYLVEQDHLIITPLEPSIGNFLICTVNRVLLRILRTKCAFELGCVWQEKVRVRGLPVLKCSFPIVVRQVKGARAYRANIPKEMELIVQVKRQGKRGDFATCPIDISVEGMLLVNPEGKHTTLQAEEKIHLELYWPRARSLRLGAKIIHVSQLRDKDGIQYCFGRRLDLATRSRAREVELLVAAVQRRRLRELSDLSGAAGVDFIDW